MHDIGRTQLEQQSSGEYGSSEYENAEYENAGYEYSEYETGEHPGAEYESGEYESGEFESGEFEGSGSAGSGPSAELESPLSETQEMEFASELLEVTSQQELEQFLGDVFRAAGHAVGNFVRSDTGRALGGILTDSLRSAAQQALPLVGQAIGGAGDGGSAESGGRPGAAAGPLLGLELEGLSAEDREFETARQLVRFVGSAAGQAAAAPAGVPAPVAARTAASRAARLYAPGLLPRLQGRSTRSWPRSGRWVRRGRTIVLYGF